MTDKTLIGQYCEYCENIITDDDTEAHLWHIEHEDGHKEYPRGDIPVCCWECHYEIDDGNNAAANDAMEMGTDYPD